MTRSFSPIKYKYGDHRIDLRRGVHINLLVRQNQMCLFMGAFYGSKRIKNRELLLWTILRILAIYQLHLFSLVTYAIWVCKSIRLFLSYYSISCQITSKHLHKYILTLNNGIMTHVICLYNMLYHRYVIAYVFHSIHSILPLYFR